MIERLFSFFYFFLFFNFVKSLWKWETPDTMTPPSIASKNTPRGVILWISFLATPNKQPLSLKFCVSGRQKSRCCVFVFVMSNLCIMCCYDVSLSVVCIVVYYLRHFCLYVCSTCVSLLCCSKYKLWATPYMLRKT